MRIEKVFKANRIALFAVSLLISCDHRAPSRPIVDPDLHSEYVPVADSTPDTLQVFPVRQRDFPEPLYPMMPLSTSDDRYWEYQEDVQVE